MCGTTSAEGGLTFRAVEGKSGAWHTGAFPAPFTFTLCNLDVTDVNWKKRNVKQLVKNIGRLFLFGLTIMLGIYVVVKLADYGWYRLQIPIGFHDANWTGKWDTEQYFGTMGRLLVRLPDPLPEDEDFKAEALVYYPIYCPWQTGRFIKMDFEGHFSPDNASSSGNSTNRIPGSGKMKFKATLGNQIVDYVAIIDNGHTRIMGSYQSQSPYDYGFFWIQYY
jgi:hypothetical protein